MTGPGDGQDSPRDQRLSAALRHAPDSEAQPPAALSAAILAAAQAAVIQPRPAVPAKPSGWRWAGLRQALQALLAPRPVWAGGAAAVLVSALTLKLWLGEPLPPVVPDGADDATVTEQARAPVAAPPPAPAPASTPATTSAAPEARSAGTVTPPAADSVEARAPARAPTYAPAPTPRAAANSAVRSAKPAPAQAAPPQDELRADRNGTRQQALAKRQADPQRDAAPPGDGLAAAAGPAAAPPEGPAPEARTPSAIPAAPPRTAGVIGSPPPPAVADAAKPAAATAGPAAAPAPVPAPTPTPAPALAQAPAAAPAAAARARSDAPAAERAAAAPTLAAKSSALLSPARTQPPSLRAWLQAAHTTADDADHPLTPARRRLLLLLQASVGSRWQSQPPTVPPAAPDDVTLAWPATGTAPAATLRLETNGARWIEAPRSGGAQWFAPLDEATLQRLRQQAL